MLEDFLRVQPCLPTESVLIFCSVQIIVFVDIHIGAETPNTRGRTLAAVIWPVSAAGTLLQGSWGVRLSGSGGVRFPS